MGYYINNINGKDLGVTFEDKCKGLLNNGATETTDTQYQEDMVCVVDNGMFAAVGHVYSEKEFNIFKIRDGRRKRWFILSNAGEFSGFKK